MGKKEPLIREALRRNKPVFEVKRGLNIYEEITRVLTSS